MREIPIRNDFCALCGSRMHFVLPGDIPASEVEIVKHGSGEKYRHWYAHFDCWEKRLYKKE